MKIILHIGQSKTGTSSIQSFLARNRSRLQSRGILYPSPRVAGMSLDLGSHNVVADALAGKIAYPHLGGGEYFEQFFEAAARCHAKTMILSAEHFFGGEPRLWQCADRNSYLEKYEKKIRNLNSYLDGHDVAIIIYLRPQVDWFASNITQVVVHGRGNGTGQVFETDRSHFESQKEVMRYGWRLDLWKSILRPEKFDVVPYVRKNLQDANSVSDFVWRAGIEGDVPAGNLLSLEANRTVSREYIEVKKRLNRMHRSAADEFAVVRCLIRLSGNSPFGTGYRIDEGVVRDLEDHVAGDNERVSRNYLPEGKKLAAREAYAGEGLEPLRPDEIESAMAQFDREYRSIRTRFLALEFSALAFLRTHARPAHVAVHQFRRLRRWVRGH